MATAKHNFQKLVFNPAHQKLVDFLDELQKLAKDAFGRDDHAIIEQFVYAKMPPRLKKSINQANLENDTKEQIVTYLEREVDLIGLEALDELQIYTVSHNAANTNADRPKPTSVKNHSEKLGHYRNQCRLLNRQKQQSEDTQNIPGNKNSGANNSVPNNKTNKKNNKNYRNCNRAGRKPKTIYPPCDTCGKTNHSTEKYYYGANAANRAPPRNKRPERQNQVQEGTSENDSNETAQAAAQNIIRKCNVFNLTEL